jgi:gliding motility-associated-like protein
MKKLLVFGLLNFIVLGAFAQLLTINQSSSITPTALDNYINNILISSGIQSNYISYSGHPEQIGFMSNGGNAAGLPFNSGIILTSGAADGLNNITGGVSGPWTLGGVSSPVWPATFSASTQVCFDLPCTPQGQDAIIQGLLANQAENVDDQLIAMGLYTGTTFMPAVVNVNDMVILEFDFIPSGDTMSFDYIFGSNEYETGSGGGYEYTQFNDIFGFFVTGPNPNNAALPYAQVNIAQVPNTTPPLPITISTINNDSNQPINTQYWNGNAPMNYPINARGFTDLMSATLPVIPCQPYHIVLTVADCGDSGFDTFVILRENSLLSVPDVQVDLNINGTTVTDNLIYEECGQPLLHIEYDPAVTPSASALLNWSGTPIAYDGTNAATYDYSAFDNAGNMIPLPTNIDLTPTSPAVDILIGAYNDFLVEGLETLQLQILTPVSGCNSPQLYNTQAVDIIINDLAPLDLAFDSLSILQTISHDTLYLACNNQTPLPFDLSGGDANYNYTWYDENGILNNATTYVYDGANLGEGYIGLTVTDGCNQITHDTLQVQYPPMIFEGGLDFHGNCGETHTVAPTVLSGTYSILYNWYADGQLFANQTQSSAVLPINQSLQFNDTTEIVIVATDLCNKTWSDTVTFFIPDAPLDIVDMADTSVCFYGVAHYSAVVQGGGGGYQVYWPTLNIHGASMSVDNIVGDLTYIVEAVDVCGSMAYDTVNIYMLPVSANFEAVTTEDNIYDFAALPCSGCTYSWDFGDGSLSTDSIVHHEFDGLDEYQVNLLVVNSIGCTDQNDFTVVAPPYYFIPSAFTPNSDGINDAFTMTGENIEIFDLKILNRWGELVFESTDPSKTWMGDFQGKGEYYVPNGVYTYTLKIKGKNKDAQTLYGNITLIR